MAKTLPNGRAKNPPFLRLPKAVLASPEWGKLSAWGKALFVDIASLYNGSNNGNLAATLKTMSEKGWRSKGTLFDALAELEAKGWIRRTRQGGKHRCNLFAVTIFPIDECKGKHDAKPTAAAPNDWKGAEPAAGWLDRLVLKRLKAKEKRNRARTADQSSRMADQSTAERSINFTEHPARRTNQGVIGEIRTRTAYCSLDLPGEAPWEHDLLAAFVAELPLLEGRPFEDSCEVLLDPCPEIALLFGPEQAESLAGWAA